ncbi:MAG: ATP-binding protein [Beijerinckiaceae bacterium]
MPRGPSLRIALVGLVITLLAGAGVVYTIWSSARSIEAEWSSRLSAVATMMSAHARQSIGAADLVLRSITDNFQELAVTDQDALREKFGTQEAFDMLKTATRSVPQIDVATIVALNGDVINFTRSFPPPRINLADRDYFQAHLRDPSLEVYLSIPVQNRGDGGWTFYLARKIRAKNGEMVGLVLTGLFSDFFANFYQSISIGPGQAMSIYRSDGALLARYPVVRSSLGKSFAESATFLEALHGQDDGVAITNTARTTDAENNETRMIAAKRDADYPLVVATNTSQSIYMAQWRKNAWLLGVAGGLLCVVLVTATIVVLRLVRELDLARTQALSAAAAKSRFASTVSHELRTPLAAIISGSTQLLDHDLKVEPLKLALVVSRSAQHLLLLINDILQFSRFDAGKETITPEAFAVRDLANHVIDITRALPHAERLGIRSVVAGHVPHSVLTDKGRLTQVLLNLLGNAVKYTASGEVTLEVDYSDGTLLLSVRDTGPGIAPADQGRIFEPFERVGRASYDAPGTGLGLSICRRIVDLLEGKLELVSEPGKGSTFLVAIPAPVIDDRASDRAAEPEMAVSRNLRVLLAEDAAALRRLMSLQLRKEGYEVTAVANGREALEYVQKSVPDFVLMDIQMPEMDGLEAARRIRALPGAAASVPIIAITAVVNELVVADTHDAGINVAISKPLNLGELKKILTANLHGVHGLKQPV